MAAEKSTLLPIANGVHVCVPDDLRLMTPYVLREQEDWFEDEIKFVRHFLHEGDHVIDIGANYGVYTLTAAKKVGSRGKVWAFEPCATTAGFLRRSIEANRFDNVEVIAAAVSSHGGVGSLLSDVNSELNCLANSDVEQAGREVEMVSLVTLDQCMTLYGWSDIALLKIDAEGHEMKVIEGAAAFLAAYAPIIMCEIKAGDQTNFAPIERLQQLGYDAYRLVPGLNVLTILDRGAPLDGYQLNVFCCRSDRAAEFEREGFLSTSPESGTAIVEQGCWQRFVGEFAYGRMNLSRWATADVGRADALEYRQALDAYAISRCADYPLATRLTSLEHAHARLCKLLEHEGTIPRALSFVRVAADLGKRQHAVAMLQRLLKTMQRNRDIEISEPFLALSSEFEQIDPGNQIGNWIVASVLERYESLRTFSSYFAPAETLSVVASLKQLGFCTSAMERRATLLQQCGAVPS